MQQLVAKRVEQHLLEFRASQFLTSRGTKFKATNKHKIAYSYDTVKQIQVQYSNKLVASYPDISCPYESTL